uniref:Uncharacterized protein n=1 Tax=Anguilla anguilla TaxID=7936 RepID=A0A0E9PFY4_ANGAN
MNAIKCIHEDKNIESTHQPTKTLTCHTVWMLIRCDDIIITSGVSSITRSPESKETSGDLWLNLRTVTQAGQWGPSEQH